MKHLACAALVAAMFPGMAVAADPALPYTLPATLENGRFFVTPATAETHRTIRLFTDTGGGYFLGETGARALGIEVDPDRLPKEGAKDFDPQTVAWPDWSANAWIPASHSSATLPIFPDRPGVGGTYLRNGMLGAPWFGGRCWEFDYAAGTLRLLPDAALPQVPDEHRVALGFQKDADGAPTMHFPRITVRIDGEPVELLFDTGATVRLAPEALTALADGLPAERATGFIVESVAKRWREAHPDWRFIEAADLNIPGMGLLQVPAVEIGGYTTGPVWFTLRPDGNFHQYMSQWMDKPIDGALGGNALAGFRVTVDYPSETATFERP